MRENLDVDTYQNTEDAFALLNIVELAERDIENGRVRKAADVFNAFIWKIIYKIDGKIVNVLTIIDTRRNLQDILVKKFLASKF